MRTALDQRGKRASGMEEGGGGVELLPPLTNNSRLSRPWLETIQLVQVRVVLYMSLFPKQKVIYFSCCMQGVPLVDRFAHEA